MATAAQDFQDARARLGGEAIRRAIDEAAPVGERAPIRATPYRCRDPRTIPLRAWIYGRQFLRGSLSVVVSPGAVGKTSLMAGTALAMVTGRALLGKQVVGGPKRCWLWNLEDSADEMSRLLEAARLHWGIRETDIADRLFVDSGLEGAGLCIAIEDHTGFRIQEPIVEQLVAELKARKIDCLIVDPFVSSHAVGENNNGAIDAIAKKWARVGVLADCAICLVHHTKKLNGAEVTAESSRGASSLTNAARSVVALNRMSAEEASQWGIEGDDRRRYFRTYDDKNNRAPPASASDWFYLSSVYLGNGQMGDQGDSIPVVLPWTPPDAFTGLTWEHLRDIQLKLGTPANPKPVAARTSPQSSDWIGITVAEHLGLDVGDKAKGKDAGRVKTIIKTWVANGALVETKERDDNNDLRPFYRAGEEARPEATAP